MSFKKSDKKGKKSPSGSNSRNALSTSPPGAASGYQQSSVPEASRAKLLELFGQIEQQFELMHCENIACECPLCSVDTVAWLVAAIL